MPEDESNKFVDLHRAECENCWRALPQVCDASAKRYQQTEIPPVDPYTTEWRRHAGPCCGYRTRARYDESLLPAPASTI